MKDYSSTLREHGPEPCAARCGFRPAATLLPAVRAPNRRSCSHSCSGLIFSLVYRLNVHQPASKLMTIMSQPLQTQE